MSTTQYENIYYNQSRVAGKIRISDGGLGWKAIDKSQGGSASKVTEPVLMPSAEIQACHWSRGARGYELRVQTKNKGVMRLDGFDSEDFNSLKNALKNDLDMQLEVKDHSLRGWNWGKMDFERSEMVFNVANKPSFEIPYSDVSNTNLVNKNEVAVEFDLQQANERSKAGDELVEMRFYVPGIVTRGDDEKTEKVEKNENEEEAEGEDEEVEEESAASVFYEELKERADIGQVAGEAIAAFSDVYLLTPRGRYDIDLYSTSFRLRGKSYDYKLQYNNIQRLFHVPKPDGLHQILAIQVDPPLRQGQTRYPFLLLQFQRQEVMELELNLSEEDYEAKYKDKLKMKYDEAASMVVAQVLRGVADRKVISADSFKSIHGEGGVSCSNKASEGYLFPLAKGFLFLPKPTMYLASDDIQNVTFSRLSSSSTSGRTFDITVKMRNGTGHQFSNIEREEQKGLQSYLKTKNISIKEEKPEMERAMPVDVGDDSDEEMADRGSAGEDSESDDADFGSDDASDSDVAEEYDAEHQTDSEPDEEKGDDNDDEDEKSRVKKKAKN